MPVVTGNVEILHRAQMGQDVYIQDLKNIKNVKRCRDSMPKSMQTR